MVIRCRHTQSCVKLSPCLWNIVLWDSARPCAFPWEGWATLCGSVGEHDICDKPQGGGSPVLPINSWTQLALENRGSWGPLPFLFHGGDALNFFFPYQNHF